MKFSLALCAIVLAAGWQNHRSMARSQARHSQLAAAAQLAGISIDPTAAESSARRSKRERTSTQVDMKLLLSDMQLVLRYRYRDPTPEELLEIESYMTRCARLSPEQMEAFLASIYTLTDLSEQDRKNMVQMTLLAFSETQPAHAIHMAVLDPSTASPGDYNAIMTNAIRVWSEDDLSGAVQWAKANPNIIHEGIRWMLIERTAEQDLAQGLRLITDFHMNDPIRIFPFLLTKAKPEESQVILTSLRQYLAQLPDEPSRESASQKLFSEVTDSLTLYAYETNRKWLDTAKLTLPELEIFSTKVAANKSIKDPNQWINWIGKNLPADKSTAPIQSIVRNWTKTDYQAAGKWLTNAPAGPTKNAAIRAYAETVAKADPEVAMQWALTLPPGPEREETLQRIKAK